ncbi:MAG: HRDC domain-containing protein [Trueperaceae bacterium]|nr:MAG: HRDC domain-containing protein [Trueperaceae bacterium]
MKNQQLIAYALIAIGAVTLLTRINFLAQWLWIGLIAVGFLAAYLNKRQYGFLVAGSILTGIAFGIMLERSLGSGAFLISLGFGCIAIDQVERRDNRWPRSLGGLLIALGIFAGLLDSGFFASAWFPLILIALGIFLFIRRQRSGAGQRPFSTFPIPDITVPAEPAPVETESPLQEEGVTAQPELQGSSQDENETALDETTQHRLQILEGWRRDRAERDNRAPYLILNNETLGLVAQANPKTLEALLAIKGIGPVKLERYGPDILDVLKDS